MGRATPGRRTVGGKHDKGMHRNLEDAQESGKHVNVRTTDSRNGWAINLPSETLTRRTGCLNWARPGLLSRYRDNRPYPEEFIIPTFVLKSLF